MSDKQREKRVISQLTDQLKVARKVAKNPIVMTHFVPNSYFIRYTDDFRFWNMANAMMGSANFEKVINDFKVDKVLFGHIHKHQPPVKIEQTWYYNGAVGYNNLHYHNEWQTDNFMAEWIKQLKVFEVF